MGVVDDTTVKHTRDHLPTGTNFIPLLIRAETSSTGLDLIVFTRTANGLLTSNAFTTSITSEGKKISK